MKKYIFVLLLMLMPVMVFAADSCSALYERYGSLIKGYDDNNNNYVSEAESLDAVRDWFDKDLSNSELMGVLEYSRSNCKIPIEDIREDKASGTLRVSSRRVSPGDTIRLTITGQDDNGVEYLWAHYHDEWHKVRVTGTNASHTFTFIENEEGAYFYMGYVSGKTVSRGRDASWTSPKTIAVAVVDDDKIIIDDDDDDDIIDIETTDGPDLKIISISTNPRSPTTQDNLGFTLKVKNIGDETAKSVGGNSLTRIYWKANTVWTTYCDAIPSTIRPGVTVEIDCPTGRKFPAGENKFNFYVDANHKVVESSSDNNAYNGKIVNIVNVANSVDAQATATLTVSDVSPKPGAVFSFTVTGRDEDGIKSVSLYQNGKWSNIDCHGATYCSKVFKDQKFVPGKYSFYGYVYSSDSNNKSVGVRTSPYKIIVDVKSSSTCSDTDGGLNYYKFGQANSTISGVEGRKDCCKASYTTQLGDSVKHIGPGGGACVDSGKYLYEAYCSNGVPFTKVKTCDCEDGVCQ